MLVADDEGSLQAALRDLIEGEAGLELVGVAGNADAAIDLAQTTQPDVALLDVRMPGGGGPRAAREIRTASPETSVVALSAHFERASVLEMLQAGAIGYLVKGESPTEIVDAVRRAARGQASLSADLVAELVRDLGDREPPGQNERAGAVNRAVLSQLVAAEEGERRRIAGDIHDDSIQVMTAAGMRLQILRRALVEPEQIMRLDELEQAIGLSIARLRHLLFELRPFALEREGLASALELYLDEAAKECETTYELRDLLLSQPPEQTRIVLYRIAQEVVTNVSEHAGATSATVTIGDRDEGYYLQVADDGVGFVYDREAARLLGQVGLTTTHERAELAGGWLRIESAEGKGTTVEVWIPRAEAGVRTSGPENEPP